MSGDEAYTPTKEQAGGKRTIAEFAKSNRSTCKSKTCGNLIEKGVPRLGLVTPAEGFDGGTTSYYHVPHYPFPARVVSQGREGVVNWLDEHVDFSGEEDLRAATVDGLGYIGNLVEDKLDEGVEKLLASPGYVERPPEDAVTEFTEAEKEAARAVGKTPEELLAHSKYSKLTVAGLKATLRLNNQLIGGNRAEVLQRVVDRAVLGAIPKCPLCGDGKLKFDKDRSIYECPGCYDEELGCATRCRYSTANLERLPWVDPTRGYGTPAEAKALEEAAAAKKAGPKKMLGPASEVKIYEEGDIEGPNGPLVDIIKRLARAEHEHGDNRRATAYKKSVSALAAFELPISHGKEVQHLPGVGRGTVARIDEFLATGWLEKLTELGEHPKPEDHLNKAAQDKAQANIKEQVIKEEPVVKQQPAASKKRRRPKKEEEEEVKPALVTQTVKCARCNKEREAPASLCPLPETWQCTDSRHFPGDYQKRTNCRSK